MSGCWRTMSGNKMHGKKAFYVYNQHINYTNICKNRCLFCAYAVDKGDTTSYSWSMEEIERRLMERIDEPIRELHIVGGLNPDHDFSYFIDLLKQSSGYVPMTLSRPSHRWKSTTFPISPAAPLLKQWQSLRMQGLI